MKILQVHNYYQQPGGEDAVVAAERALLESHGHQVLQYTKHNDEVERTSRLQLIQKTIYNRESEREVRDLLERESPDIVHAHNTFPLISPSLYHAAAQSRIPVIQTLHNFRLLCPSATLFRDGRICEDCVGRIPYPAVIHACYRGNRAASAATACMVTAHNLMGTWHKRVHTFVTLSEFSKTKFVEGGFDGEKIKVKPNFLPQDPGYGDGCGGYAFFAGRLAREKGLGVLMDAWARLRRPIPLKIAGDGELMPWLRERAGSLKNVEILGHCDRAAMLGMLKDAALLIMPSEWYEAGVPLTIIEAFGCGTPVLTSQLPSMDEVIVDGQNGYRFATGSGESLAQRLETIWSAPAVGAEMRQAARASYERRYTPAVNYPALMNIYVSATKACAGGPNELAGTLPENFLGS